MQVAVVQDDEVHMASIRIYRCFEDTVELRDGLSGGEKIVVNPPVDLKEHYKAKERPSEEQAKSSAAACVARVGPGAGSPS